MNQPVAQPKSPTERIVLLAGQAFTLGLTAAWITISASAIFLEVYGSSLLPVTYIGAAFAGAASSAALTVALRRRPLVGVATRVLAGLSITLLLSWLALWVWSVEWVSFALLVLVPIVVPVGFVFVVGQAGMLLEVRVLKALYARVIAGFALGFVTGGLVGPLLLTALGRTEHLLAAASVVAGAFLVLVVVTRRRFPGELSVVEHDEDGGERPTMRALLRDRYVMLIVAFQMLSAIESQWLDFLVLDRAAQRYEDSRELARFISQFTAIAYGADIVFLLLFAGLLLRRFGLRYGLTANPLGVLTLLGAMILAASLQGSGATIVFVLIVAARVTDLMLSDGAARNSLSAAYQVVPGPLRLVAQATVEGLAVPVAIGISGLVLLVLGWTGGTDGMILPIFTSVVVSTWTLVALFMYRGYRTNLLARLRRRSLDPEELIIDGANAIIVFERLVESEDERDVRLALDALTTAEHPELGRFLERLARDDRLVVRADALDRLITLDGAAAASAARDGLGHQDPEVRALCVRQLGSLGDPSDLTLVSSLADDRSPAVQVAAAAALARLGDDAIRARVGSEIAVLAASGSAADRIVAAQMYAECEPGDWLDRSPLAELLADADSAVVNATLAALRWPDDEVLLVDVTNRLVDRLTAAAATAALVRGGDAVLDIIDRLLGEERFERFGQVHLARVCRDIGGSSATAVLRAHIEHTDREVGLAVMSALAVLGPPAKSGGDTASESVGESAVGEEASGVVATDLEHATHVLRALHSLRDEPAAGLLVAALRDELELLRQRVLAGLSIRHGVEGLNRVAFQFAQRDTRSHSLALEWLDVTLTGTDRAVVPLLDPDLSDRERLRGLTRWFPLDAMHSDRVVRDLVEDRDGRWRRPWITACALYVASLPGAADVHQLVLIVETSERASPAGRGDDAEIVRETVHGLRQREATGPEATPSSARI